MMSAGPGWNSPVPPPGVVTGTNRSAKRCSISPVNALGSLICPSASISTKKPTRFTGNLLLNCATCTAGAFTTTIPLLVSPFDNGFHLVESGFVLDPTTANDTFHINYVIGADNIGAVVQYDVDGSGATAPSTGTGVAPIVP